MGEQTGETAETGLATLGDDELVASQEYQDLVTTCRNITESARRSALDHYWRLGQAISMAAPRAQREEYGAKLILQLEQDLAVDRTTLIRSVQLYEQFDREQLEIGARGHLSWRKLRMLLPLAPDQRDSLLKRILAGELRTDEQVRLAILDLKEAAGDRKALPSHAARDQLHLAGFGDEVVTKPLSTVWNKLQPTGRAMFVTSLVPALGLEEADRPEALDLLGALRRQVDDYERRLGEGAD